MADLRPRVDDTPLSPKAKKQLIVLIALLFIVGFVAVVTLKAGKSIISHGTPEVIHASIGSATIEKGTLCVDLLPKEGEYDPNSIDINSVQCVRVEKAFVDVNQNANSQGTIVTIAKRTDVDNAYGITHYSVVDSILVWVRTEKERKQYQDLIDAEKVRMFSQRDVVLQDGNKPGN